MVRIAECESNLTHYKKDGEVLRGYEHAPDTGVMQINTDVHGQRLKTLDLDAERLWDNLSFARMLFEESGEKPWTCYRLLAQR